MKISGAISQRSAVLAVALVLTLSGCSGSEDGAPKVEVEATQDVQAKDEQAVKDLYDRFWEARIESENTATVDQDTYAGILEGPNLESLGRRITQYQDRDLVRVGEPVISNVDVSVADGVATILACQDEDNWRAEIDGEVIPRPDTFGNVGTGATAERRGDAWVLTELNGGDDSRCS